MLFHSFSAQFLNLTILRNKFLLAACVKNTSFSPISLVESMKNNKDNKDKEFDRHEILFLEEGPIKWPLRISQHGVQCP